MYETYRVKGMHCASCAGIIERTLKKRPEVKSAEVNYGNETAKVSFNSTPLSINTLSDIVEPLGYSFESSDAAAMGMSENKHADHPGINQSKKEKLAEIADMRSKLISVIPLAIFSIFVMGWDILGQLNYVPSQSSVWKDFFHHILPLMATYTLFVVGKPYLLGIYRFIRYGKANMDTLIGIGTTVAYVYSFIIAAFEESLKQYINVEHSYYDVTIVVIAFITLGKCLEARSKIKTGDAIEKLLNLQAKTALVIRNGKEIEIPINEVIKGDQIILKPGAKVPVDGVVIEGISFIDESMLTGEPMPIEKKPGTNIAAGTINTTGTITFEAKKIGSETLLAHIIKMVEDAQGSKAPIQALADKISAVFVPIVLIIALVTFGAWMVLGTPVLGFSQSLSYGLTSFVGVLIIACPCALGLATPTAIIVGVGKGAKEGILIKNAETLEKLHKVDVVVVDKTGTITKGKPELVKIKNLSQQSDEDLVSILASLENRSEHPIASAISNYAKNKQIQIKTIEGFEIIKGKGLKAKIAGKEYFAGNMKLIDNLSIDFNDKEIIDETSKGRTPVILATSQNILGIFLVADAIKDMAVESIKKLHALKIKVVMLTGDNKQTADYIAKEAGIDEVIAEVMPEDKLKKIQSIQNEGHIVAMAGDGINDAPALAQADVGIAMGTGTDAAIETAGITLLNGDISKLVSSIKLSKMIMTGVKQNLFWAFIYNLAGIPLAAGLFFPFFGWLISPVFAGLAMAFSSFSVVSNSLRLKAKKL